MPLSKAGLEAAAPRERTDGLTRPAPGAGAVGSGSRGLLDATADGCLAALDEAENFSTTHCPLVNEVAVPAGVPSDQAVVPMVRSRLPFASAVPHVPARNSTLMALLVSPVGAQSRPEKVPEPVKRVWTFGPFAVISQDPSSPQ